MKCSFTRRLSAAAVLALVSLALASVVPGVAAQEGAATEAVERTVALPSGGSFSLSNINGMVAIEGWDREEVQIVARKYGLGEAESLRAVSIDVVPSERSVFVQARYPDGGAAEVRVDFHIRVPMRVRLASVTTVNGSITARNVNGTGNLAAVNGSVSVIHAAGLFSARATNGNVALELVSLDGGAAPELPAHGAFAAKICAETVNGSVDVALPPGAGAELDARTRNGEFSTDMALLARTSAAGRSVKARVGEGGPLLVLRTVNGPIRLRTARLLV